MKRKPVSLINFKIFGNRFCRTHKFFHTDYRENSLLFKRFSELQQINQKCKGIDRKPSSDYVFIDSGTKTRITSSQLIKEVIGMSIKGYLLLVAIIFLAIEVFCVLNIEKNVRHSTLLLKIGYGSGFFAIIFALFALVIN